MMNIFRYVAVNSYPYSGNSRAKTFTKQLMCQLMLFYYEFGEKAEIKWKKFARIIHLRKLQR